MTWKSKQKCKNRIKTVNPQERRTKQKKRMKVVQAYFLRQLEQQSHGEDSEQKTSWSEKCAFRKEKNKTSQNIKRKHHISEDKQSWGTLKQINKAKQTKESQEDGLQRKYRQEMSKE